MSSVFVADLEAAVKLFVEKWQDHPEGANALAQKHEAELVRQELRPLVFEEVRLQVDQEMRILLQNLKVWRPAQLLSVALSCTGLVGQAKLLCRSLPLVMSLHAACSLPRLIVQVEQELENPLQA